MHDLDRIIAEVDSGELYQGETSFDRESDSQGEAALDEILQEAGVYETTGYELDQQEAAEPEYGSYETANFEADQEDVPLSEVEEMELATELLGVSSEEELDQFLGKLFKKAWRGVRNVARGIAKPLGGVLKAVAKKALPMVGGALGTMFGGPAGGMIGSRLASGAGSLFGLELEGLSPEDREYEVARRFVRFASSAASRAARANRVSPPVAVRQSLNNSARRFAPGLLRARGYTPAVAVSGPRSRGVWIRRGRAIVLLGL